MTPPPALEDLGEDRLELVRIAVRHCLMPHPDVVASIGGAVFPSIRDQKHRLTIAEINGRPVLLDDNVTPRWALLWAHGVKNTEHLKGWTFAHVWGQPKNPDAYTNLANLCMMPEFFGSLSDKDGPLSNYLKFHAWSRYGWSPDGAPPPQPDDFIAVQWRYLPAINSPRDFINERLSVLNNQRTRMLQTVASSLFK